MGKQTTENYRGKGVSTKLAKNGQPKHSGNWSAATIHIQSLQYKDWKVRRIDGVLIVGEKTKLTDIFPEQLISAIDSDQNFESLNQKGTHTHNGKQYEARRSLRKATVKWYMWDGYEYIYREEIYTDGDFNYNFKEY